LSSRYEQESAHVNSRLGGTFRQQIFERVQRLSRESLERIVFRDGAFIARRYSGWAAMTRRWVELEKGGELASCAHESLHGVVEPVIIHPGLDGRAGRRSAAVGAACGVRQTTREKRAPGPASAAFGDSGSSFPRPSALWGTR